MIPSKISRSTEKIEITWHPTDQPTVIEAFTLRAHCPCASCRANRGEDSHEKPLSPKKSRLNVLQNFDESADADKKRLSIERIWAVGNYALGIAWGDKHDTGIYPFALLKELGVSNLTSGTP